MKIKHKLIISAITQSFITVICLGSIINWIATDTTRTALEEKAQNQLISLRDTTKDNIETYFRTINNQVITFSNDHMIIDAMTEFSAAFHRFKDQSNSYELSTAKSQLRDYYSGDFAKEFRNRNNGKSSKALSWLEQLDDDSILLQDAFISSNNNLLGEKDKLANLAGNSVYAQLHSKYHEHIRDFQSRFGFYDIFLVDPNSGDIVYSVFKELDYATSLIKGPFVDTGIGEAFKRANLLSQASDTILTDFSPYPPSYMDMASFIASPIYDNGQKIGILIFQMPIDIISSVMTHNNKWSEAGLGESGETYLVGDDYTAKTLSRFLVEDPEGYYSVLQESGVSSDIIEAIRTKKSNIGLQKINTEGVEEGLAGHKGYKIFDDYRNVPVLSAYSPVDIAGLNWVILAEIDVEETFRTIETLSKAIGTSSITVGVVVLILGVFASWLLASYISKLLNQMSLAMEAVANGDLTQRLDDSGNDEISEISGRFNQFVVKLQQMMTNLTKVTADLDLFSRRLSTIADDCHKAISGQQSQTEQLATAMTEMQATLNEVARNVHSASLATQNIGKESSTAKQATEETLSASKNLAELLSDSSVAVSMLEKDSDAIGSVLDVIKQIAEQTNLLALNAAIEAARAGEQGRGFAVVADEVRTLASRTQISTTEIQTTIEKLQSAAKQSVSSMNKSTEQAVESELLSNKTYSVLNVIDESIISINDMTTQIATASEEQAAVAEDINRNVSQISQLCHQSVEKADETTSVSGQINQLSIQITELVKQFKI